ncbi:uncharacterized protein LOC136036776 [Artemia franciscana]|uniref:uncharacterized protein LOC136036776 n=1 Tax=Artemia franciscana TaxID=6661 RepID=UPI0032DA9AF8
MVRNSEMADKIKRAFADNITKKYRDELMKKKSPANVTASIDSLLTDTANKSNNTGRYTILISFGFRKNRKTEDALIFLTSIINMALDKGFKVGVVYLDLMKAFDTVDHGLLLEKCEVYVIRGKALDLIQNFHSNQYQFV